MKLFVKILQLLLLLSFVEARHSTDGDNLVEV